MPTQEIRHPWKPRQKQNVVLTPEAKSGNQVDE
jgi:hypothetical protein